MPRRKLTELSLFSGAGGGLLGTKILGWQTIGYVEKDKYCQNVLRARIRDGFLDDAPIFSDIRTFDGLQYRERVDIITAGFPCQPFSVAGRRKGSNDDRNMWPDTIRVIREVNPRMAFLENVPGLLGKHGYFGNRPR
jgi:DNA (cytosine-5)-methyltransferase 1